MTSIHIEPNYAKKTARISKEVVAAGEKVAVSIEMPTSLYHADLPELTSLRLRVFFGHHIIAQFPAPDTDDEWQTENSNLVCTLNLNTVQARRICRGPETTVLLVLESIGNAAQLYFTNEWQLKGWPGIETDETPTDFSVYAFPTLVTAWRNELVTAGSRIAALEAVSTATNSALASEHNRVTQLTTRVENEEARATTKELELAEDLAALDASINALEQTHNNDKAALSAAVADEARQRAEAVASLRDDLDTEHSERADAILAIHSALSDEAQARRDETADLSRDLSGETARATAAEKTLQTQLLGKADLVDGKVPASQLPSYVDDVLEFADTAAFPHHGESGKIYIAKDTNKTYRWGDTVYVEISSPYELGDTDGTAFPGPRGKALEDALSQKADRSDLAALAPIRVTARETIEWGWNEISPGSAVPIVSLSTPGNYRYRSGILSYYNVGLSTGNNEIPAADGVYRISNSVRQNICHVRFAGADGMSEVEFDPCEEMVVAVVENGRVVSCDVVPYVESGTVTEERVIDVADLATKESLSAYATTDALAQAPQTVYQNIEVKQIHNEPFHIKSETTYYKVVLSEGATSNEVISFDFSDVNTNKVITFELDITVAADFAYNVIWPSNYIKWINDVEDAALTAGNRYIFAVRRLPGDIILINKQCEWEIPEPLTE